MIGVGLNWHMIDKMRKSKKPHPLNHIASGDNFSHLNLLERGLISQLIELSYDENTLHTLSLSGLKLLGKHPLLKIQSPQFGIMMAVILIFWHLMD